MSSLLAGLDAIDDPQLEAVMVTPVDVPLVHAVDGRRCDRGVAPHARADRRPEPVRQAQRHGHPVIFDRSIFDDLRSADPDVGAKAVFATPCDRVLNVEVKDAGAFEDIDTPEDYQACSRALKVHRFNRFNGSKVHQVQRFTFRVHGFSAS